VSDPAYDGLCGIASTFTDWKGNRFRCKYEMGHGSDHEWEKYRLQFVIFGGITHREVVDRAALGSPAAQAILATSEGKKQT